MAKIQFGGNTGTHYEWVGQYRCWFRSVEDHHVTPGSIRYLSGALFYAYYVKYVGWKGSKVHWVATGINDPETMQKFKRHVTNG